MAKFWIIFLVAVVGFLIRIYIIDNRSDNDDDKILTVKNPLDCTSVFKAPFNGDIASSSGKNAAYNFSLTDNDFECFFSQDYFIARDLFINSLKSVKNSQLKSFPIYKDLTMDVGIIPGSKGTKKALLHISGTHGPEGYAGSAVQSALLTYLSTNTDFDTSSTSSPSSSEPSESSDAFSPESAVDRPNIVFVHALNPYGFANNRRVNEDNVDLNRNFLKDSQFSFVKSRDPDFAGYVSADFVINPKSFPSSVPFINDIHGYLMMAYAATVVGMQTLKKALVSGNYYKKEGLGFGGFQRTTSADALIALVQTLDEISNAEDILLIDVHTGLGPKGIDTLGVSSTITNIDSFFKTEYFHGSDRPLGGLLTLMKAADADSALSGYELTVGTVTEDFCQSFLGPNIKNSSNKLCITQEFGTRPMMVVGKSLVDENCAFQNSKSIHESLKMKYTKKLRDSFFVDDSLFWKRNVVRRGIVLFFEGISYLHR